ncbi:MAG TPA: serine--tRNA ligase [Acidimicrobiales bacterium]|nr:serine--tRNA ligase [Acidimicrobiales bacterium]
MLDIRRLRTDLDAVKASLATKNVDPSEVDAAAELDRRVRALQSQRDELRGQVKTLSAEVGKARKAGDTAAADAAQQKSKELGENEAKLASETGALETELRDRMLRIPNTPDPAALVGKSEDDNQVVRTDDVPVFAEHQRVPHWEIGAELGILDTERAVKVAGSMFVALRGLGATMARALCQLALDRNADAYEEIRPPTMVLTDTLTATGQLPKFADDAYHVERDDLWPIPTAEVPLTSFYRDEILTEAELPKRLMAYSPCYRREAGSAGKDTRGLLRGHEFDKVEILALGVPEQAQALHEEILERAIGTLKALGLTTRVLEICTGDLGQSHARQFDVEVYAPGIDRWLEASSCSWFSDYQARRANIRYRPADGGPAFVHTFNGSALAVPRVLAALLEQYRNADGSVTIPEALRPYCRGATVITP